MGPTILCICLTQQQGSGTLVRLFVPAFNLVGCFSHDAAAIAAIQDGVEIKRPEVDKPREFVPFKAAGTLPAQSAGVSHPEPTRKRSKWDQSAASQPPAPAASADLVSIVTSQLVEKTKKRKHS